MYFFIVLVEIFTLYCLSKTASTDRTLPVIEMDSESVMVSVTGGDEAILKGVEAIDAKDGETTENIFIESRSAFIEPGRL